MQFQFLWSAKSTFGNGILLFLAVLAPPKPQVLKLFQEGKDYFCFKENQLFEHSYRLAEQASFDFLGKKIIFDAPEKAC